MKLSHDVRGTRISARWRSVAASVLAALLAIPLFVSIPSPALAAGGTLNLTVEAVNPTVNSGEGASFRMQWTCAGSGSCDDTKIEVPVPAGVGDSAAFPAGVPLTVSSQSGVNLGAGEIPGSAVIVGTAPNQTLVWNFPAVVATGAAGTVSFTLTSPNSVTPNGTTITPVATITATGANPVTANGDGAELTTVQSEVSLKVTKTKQSPTDVPYVNQQVTYALMVGYDAQFPSNTNSIVYQRTMGDVCQTHGVQAVENLTVVDTLPAGAEFVSATHGGTFDVAANAVTWALGSSINDTAPFTCKPYSGTTSWTGVPILVTVKYPSPTFAADPSVTAVTNGVTASANKWGQPDELLSSENSASHARALTLFGGHADSGFAGESETITSCPNNSRWSSNAKPLTSTNQPRAQRL